jgi:serine/threonine-protein kinase
LLPIVVVVLTLAIGAGGAYIVLRPDAPSSEADSSGIPPGSAARQQPQPGSVVPTTTTSTEVELTVAPDLVGRKLAEAQDMLPRSLQLDIVDSIEQTAQPGTVIEQSPKPGEPVDGKMKLTVAREAAQVYLDDLKTINEEWSVRNDRVGSLAGKTYPHTVGAQVSAKCSSTQEAESVEYTIYKGFRRFVATGGIDDESADTALKVQLEIFGDGRKLATQVLEYGKPVEITADLSGVLRLKFLWQVQSGSRCGNSLLDLGEARLLGLPGEVPTSGVPASGSSSGSSATTTTTR